MRRRLRPARAPAKRPHSRRIWSWSQSARFWSMRRIGSPPGSVRAAAREAFSSIRASSPYASGSCGAMEVSTRPMRSASLQSWGRSQSSPRAAV